MTNQNSNKATTDYPVGIFNTVFSGNEYFLADHVIFGNKILPGMAYLEMARAAVANSLSNSNDYIIVLKESVFVQAMMVAEKCAVETKVYPGARGEFGIEISTDKGGHFHSKAYIHPKNSQLPEELVPGKLDIPALEQKCIKDGPTKSQFYTKFSQKGINIGLSLSGIETIKLGDDFSLVSAKIPGASKRGMVLDIGMFDSFIQSADALVGSPEKVNIPYAVGTTQIYGALNDRMYGYIVNTGEGVDFTIADEEGEVKVIIRDFVGHEFGGQQEHVVLYRPDWQYDEGLLDETNEAKNVTVIKNDKNYTALVHEIITTAQELIKQKVENHNLEIQLGEDKQSWRGIIALLKTIHIEYPKIKCKLFLGNKQVMLGYAEADMAGIKKFQWPDNKTILITGGMGGIGKIISADIAKQTKGCTLLLTGRSSLNEDKKAFIDQLQIMGVNVNYVSCDITNQSEVKKLVADYPQISGVIHCSGLNKDNLIGKKTLGEINQVLAPKVNGIEILDEAIANLNLDYFVAMSSIAGTLGNSGQADYAAANGYMDTYIHRRAEQVKNQQRYGKSISINWALWDSEGMQLDEATKESMQNVLKMKALPAEKGLLALKQIIASDMPQLVVTYGVKQQFASLFKKSTLTRKKTQGKNSQVDSEKLLREIEKTVRTEVAEHLQMQPEKIDETADWAKFGFDSILISSFINKFNTKYDLKMMPTVLFEATNMSLFIQYLEQNFPDKMTAKLMNIKDSSQQTVNSTGKEQNTQEEDSSGASNFVRSFKKAYKSNIAYRDKDIAIVGMSCRIAGARNPKEFWNMLDEERAMITEVPRSRWDWRDYPGVSKWGSFIDGVEEFDSLFFGISPAEAIYMAPEQRLMMQYVWECLEDAGYSNNELKGTNTGLFIGCGPTSYAYFLDNLPVEAYTATGFVPSVGPNRISYFLDWHGPSNPIETACSSALVAVHRAVEAIRTGHCDHAMVGGVNLLLSPEGYISFSKSGMLSEDGRCKTFSDKANGYVRGEGIGMILLKPLKAAIQDGNIIYAVVKGTAENHGGRTNSLTAPSPKSQSAVVKKAVSDANIDFSRVSYIECHGTGTALGDPVEIEGLKIVAGDLLKENDDNQICKLGSIKSNIGHLEYGAGIVGIIKVLLQMKHKKIAKSLFCDKINPYIDLEGTSFQIAQSSSDWDVPEGQTRVAGVSSFGFGGVNSHVVLEEYIETADQIKPDVEMLAEQQAQILVISARNEEGLMNLVEQFPEFLKTIENTPDTLKRIAFTLQLGRTEMTERLAFVANSVKEWSDQIDVFLQENAQNEKSKIFRGTLERASANSDDNNLDKERIKQMIETHEHDKIAKLWVKGSKINWEAIYS